jgi:hypothetical protein
MSAFVRERVDRDWYRGLKVPAAVLLNIDEKTKKAVSGTGGTWAPSAAITVGGAGLELQCALQLTGALATPAAGKFFIFGDDDYFQNDALVSRVITVPSTTLLGDMTLEREATFSGDLTTTPPRIQTRRPGSLTRFPLWIPDGSFLSTVVISFRVFQAHASAPYPPKARVVRIAADGTISQHPNPSGVVDPDGWFSIALPASGAAWYAAGVIQTHTLTYSYSVTEQTDSEMYGYALEWSEEHNSLTSPSVAFAPLGTSFIGNIIENIKVTIYQPDIRPY